MLESLRIKNLAVIDSADLSFKNGLNILSGETGAGKSIIIQAISLILGSRASSGLVRTGCNEAVVEGLFDISKMPWIDERLERLGYDPESSELLIKRMISTQGKHRVYVNGELATLSILQELCTGLVDLCGQHEHQSLLRAQTQIELLDRYGGLEKKAHQVSAAFSEVKDLSREREELLKLDEDRFTKRDFLKFQLEELTSAELQTDEEEALKEEKLKLQESEKAISHFEDIRRALEGEGDSGVMDRLRKSLSLLNQLKEEVDPMIEQLRGGLERASAELEEVDLVLNRYLESSELDPDRLSEIQDRLALIAKLRRKYGTDVPQMLENQHRIEKELETIEKMEEKLSEIDVQIEEAKAELYSIGKSLSVSRKKAGGLLSDSVTAELKDLKMGDAEFTIDLKSKEDLSTWSAVGGADDIQFLIRTNKGENARPLSKIASGGELSRIMLSIRRVIADSGQIGVYLFDEIDAGIGGQTAFQVGKKLKSVSEYNQVICITHLPQVASFADHHLSVQKKVEKGRTITSVVGLDLSGRKEEIARMLGGPKLTKNSLQNAAELIQMAR